MSFSPRAPNELKERHPEIDWQAIAAAGNVYRHEYEGTNEALIWHTLRHGLNLLRSIVEAELKSARAK